MKTLISLFGILSLSLVIACAGPKGSSGGGGLTPGEGPLDGCGIMRGEACDLFLAINEYRVASRLSPYSSLKQCIRMAQEHAEDMVANGYFDHNSPRESYQQRLTRYGFASVSVGESLARGSKSPEIVLDLLKKSTVDNGYMLSTIFSSVGVGYQDGYWTICYTNMK